MDNIPAKHCLDLPPIVLADWKLQTMAQMLPLLCAFIVIEICSSSQLQFILSSLSC